MGESNSGSTRCLHDCPAFAEPSDEPSSDGPGATGVSSPVRSSDGNGVNHFENVCDDEFGNLFENLPVSSFFYFDHRKLFYLKFHQ